MHDDFADWYRRVDIAPKSEDLQKRWRAIEAFHQNATSSDMLELVRLFFGLVPKDDSFLAKYRAEFKAIDDVFPMRENDAELQVLAGATLASYFRKNDNWATFTALAVTCGASEGARKAPVPEIVDLACRTLRDQSSSLRVAQKKISIPSPDLNENFEKLKNTLGGGGPDFQSLHGPLVDVLQPLLTTVANIATWATRTSRLEELRKEETDVLWWLFGESSRDCGVPFRDLKSPSACIIGAKELADLTRVLPGPYGADAFMDKMLSLAHPNLKAPLPLSDASVACPEEWRKSFVMIEGLGSVIDLCPVHLAVQKCIEAGGKKTAWHVPFQTVSGFKATLKLLPIALARQTYRERLFVRMFNQLEESPDD